MTPEERFERIEQALVRMAELQENHQKLMYGLQESTQKMIGDLTASVDAFVQDSRERTKRLEENLDALIRAITSEHSNGKGGKK